MGHAWSSRGAWFVCRTYVGLGLFFSANVRRVAGWLLIGSALSLGGCGAGSSKVAYAEASEPAYEEGVAYDMADDGEAEPMVLFSEAAPRAGGMKSARPRLAKDDTGADGTPRPVEPDVEDPMPRPHGDKATDQARKPMLIYRANLGLAVFQVQDNLDKIEKMAADAGGYLVGRGQNHIKVRVPAQKFESTVEAIIRLGDVHRREISADDVTAEYTDLEIRMKNAIAVRDRLQKLLDQVKNVEEALEVERELRRLTEEIEVMKGRMKLLRELAAFSTIDVQFSERTTKLKPRVELPFPWLESMGLEHLLSL